VTKRKCDGGANRESDGEANRQTERQTYRDKMTDIQMHKQK
jgi:hypothetical protein